MKFIVAPTSLIKLSTGNTERSNSLHKLIIGDRRAYARNDKAQKMLYIYQNWRAFEASQQPRSGDFLLPALPTITTVIKQQDASDSVNYIEECEVDEEVEEIEEVMEQGATQEEEEEEEEHEEEHDDLPRDRLEGEPEPDDVLDVSPATKRKAEALFATRRRLSGIFQAVQTVQ